MGLALAVVPELDDLTVGGLINGYGIEGSSHIYGLFQDTVLAYEIVLGDGTLVRATADNEYSDLYYAIPWSQGTLGLLVAAELQLIEVKPYMKVTYQPTRGSLKDMAQAYWDCFCPRDGDQDNPDKVPDFVEGMIYTKNTGVMMTGNYVDTKEAKAHWRQINEVGWWWKPWFYQHAATALKRGEFVEYIPTRQWYHRHTRSLYWEGKLILPFGDNFLFRLLLGWMMPPKVSFLKLTQGDAIRNYYHERHMCQDMLVPVYKVGEALEFNEREFEVYPIWLCPHRLYKVPQKGVMITPEPGYEKHKRPGDTPAAQMYTDVGLYYAPGPVLRGEVYDGVAACKRMEQWLIDNHSFQALYAVTELTEKDFWVMFDQTLYRNCRVKYKAQGTFMGVYYKSAKGRKSEADVLREEKAAAEQEKERIQEV
jgi:delta24-sterol reductase